MRTAMKIFKFIYLHVFIKKIIIINIIVESQRKRKGIEKIIEKVYVYICRR